MPLSESQKLYRQRPEEREKRRQYALAWRRRPEVMQRDKERAQKNRDAPGGTELNRARVRANRKALGRHYISALLADQADVKPRQIPNELVAFKRDQISLQRLERELLQAATEAKEEK